MLFNSLEFAFFLPIVFLLYWFVFKSIKQQNFLLLISSYFFYGWWDYRFLSLIIFSTLVDYSISILIKSEKRKNTRKVYLILSLLVNLGFLGFFKYYNFFAENFIQAFSFFGYKPSIETLNIILPVGISFYTFQTISYTIDVYRNKLEPTTNFVSFAAFVSFFPQLVAGPIERASNLLPQFERKRFFNSENTSKGLRQILWGLFKKTVIADNCALYVNTIFNSPADYSGIELILGAVFFAFQIYCDFSGYSDIAIGTSRLFGFNLMKNFSFPYFSRDIAEFWRKWHISLSTWFRDYLYIPLGGSEGGKWNQIRNTFIVFLVSGFWHGNNWTYIAWGFINAMYFLPLLVMNKNRTNLDVVAVNSFFPTVKELLSILFTFSITVFAWIFFRANSISEAFLYIREIFDFDFFASSKVDLNNIHFLIFILLFFEWINRKYDHGLDNLPKNKVIRWLIYLLISWMILTLKGGSNNFIYFQF